MKLIEERTVALAAILQACHQVQRLARRGIVDETVLDTGIKSIQVLDAVSTEAVFGGLYGVQPGLQLLKDSVLQSGEIEHIEIARYGMAILHLQNQLYKDSQRFQQFGQRIEGLSAYGEDEIVDKCSDVYRDFISPIRPQLIIQGEQNHLQKPEVPPRVRALLLASIRAAVLWNQKGGGRFKLIWERGRYREIAQQMLGDLMNSRH